MKMHAETKAERMRQYQQWLRRKTAALARKARQEKRPAQGVTVVIPEGGAGYGKTFKSKWLKKEANHE